MYQTEHSTHDHSGTPTLMIRRCGECSRLLAPLTVECSFCQTLDLEWVPSSGAGSIVSWRVHHRTPDGLHGEMVRSVIAIVELDDGPWMYSSIEGDIESHGDNPVRVQFQPQPPGGRFPTFAVCTAAAGLGFGHATRRNRARSQASTGSCRLGSRSE